MKRIITSLIVVAALISFSFSPVPEDGERQSNGKVVVEASPSAQKASKELGIVRLSVTSDGTSGKKWVIRLKKAGFFVHDEGLLLSKNFKATKGITYNIVIFKGKLWEKGDRNSENIKKRAAYANLSYPSLEIACLIRERISDKELDAMGVSNLIVMHDPIKGSRDLLHFMVHHDDFGSWLDTVHFTNGDIWGESCCFAFIE